MLMATERAELRAEEAALIIGRSTKTLHGYAVRGLVKVNRCEVTRTVRYDRESVEALAAKLRGR